MIEQGCRQDAEDDRQRPLEARRQQQCQQLGLVANFTDGDGQGGYEEGFHGHEVDWAKQEPMTRLPPAQSLETAVHVPKVSPNRTVECAMATAKYVDAFPATTQEATPQ